MGETETATEKSMADMKNLIFARAESLLQSEREAARYRDIIQSLQSELDAQASIQSTLRLMIKDLEHSCTTLRTEYRHRCDGLEVENKKLRQKLGNLQEQNDHLSAQLQAVFSSTSWRATGLLRRLRRTTLRHRK